MDITCKDSLSVFRRFFLIDPLSFLSVTIILYILRMVGPYVNFVFIPFLLLFFIFTILHYIGGYKFNNIHNLIIIQTPLLVISLFFLCGFIFSAHFIFFAFKELLNVLIVIFLSFSLFLYIGNKVTFDRFSWIFGKQFILFSFVVSLLGLTKLVLQTIGIEAEMLNISGQIAGTSLNTDYNYYSVFGFIGLLFLLFYREKLKITTFTLVFIILNLNILFSGSRRGILLILLIWIILLLFGFNFKFNLKRILINLIILSILVLSFIGSFYLILSLNSTKHKNQSVDLNSKFQNQTQSITSRLISRYLTIINFDKSKDVLYNELWIRDNPYIFKIKYEKYDKDRGNGNLLYNGKFNYGLLFWEPKANAVTHEIVKTPYGNGVKVSRFGGDNKDWPLLYTGRGIVFHSGQNYVLNFKFRVVSGTGIPFRIGFWTDSWFGSNGKIASLEINVIDLGNGWKQGTCSYVFQKSYSDIPLFMNSQKDSTIIEFADIQLTDSAENNTLPEYSDEISSDNQVINKYLIKFDSIADSKRNSKNGNMNLFRNGDFSNGTQYWVPYADSTFHEIIQTPFGNGIRVSRTDGDGSYWSLLYDGRPIIYYSNHNYRLKFKYKVEKGDSLPFNIGWWVNDANMGFLSYNLPLSIKGLKDGWKEATCYCKFKKTHFGSQAFLNSLHDHSVVDISDVELIDLDRNDSIPMFVDQIKSLKNLTAVGPMDSIDLRDNKSNFYSPRLNRWYYSWIVFQDSLSTSQKIFGGGFDYLESMGKTFGETKIDDPHNPFISSFLYSGIIGGFAYIWFMFLVFYYYIKYWKYHLYYFICFLVVFYFSFFSANTHFSVPVYAILCIFPFLTSHFVDNEKRNKEPITSEIIT